MSGLPRLPRSALDVEGQRLWDRIVATRGAGSIGPDGALNGPFNAWVHAPRSGSALLDVGDALRFGTSLDQRLAELAMATVGAHWKSEYEWWAHSRLAREAGISQAVIEALAAGRHPDFRDEDERLIYEVATELLSSGTVSKTTYGAVQLLLGDSVLTELVELFGFYTLICFVLNVLGAPLPSDVQPTWSSETSRPRPSKSSP